ncbi:Ubiquitin-like protein [Trachipleistophora hominis]|uniref:Ubiquitin-like protein n=1 Tax=Trachipleistophora hominis TaxID=72359 RepID=L7JUM1_TRAHO|nr:Ubiquitin-like protein [Trachipleistophora hominis]
MIITVKCTDGLGKTVFVKIDDEVMVKDLKKKLGTMINVNDHRISLKKDNFIMRDHVKLSMYQVLDGQAIQICYCS